MSRVLKFFFPVKPYSAYDSWFLLAMRVVFGLLLFSHGVAKWSNFEQLAPNFPDLLGVGSRTALVLAIFGEAICSAGFIVGAFYRLALIPMIVTMCMAFFVVHHGNPIGEGELAFVYLFVFVMMYIAGPGNYALDTVVARNLRNPKS